MVLNGRKEARDRARQLEVVQRSERMIADLLEKARLRHRAEPTTHSEREIHELEHQHQLAVDLLEDLRTKLGR
jgi:hypothetical protein